jgi:hypothetical protein
LEGDTLEDDDASPIKIMRLEALKTIKVYGTGVKRIVS